MEARNWDLELEARPSFRRTVLEEEACSPMEIPPLHKGLCMSCAWGTQCLQRFSCLTLPYPTGKVGGCSLAKMALWVKWEGWWDKSTLCLTGFKIEQPQPTRGDETDECML